MQKQEFEERIERTVTDEQYKVIEEVYMWHPSIRNTSGKDEVAEVMKWKHWLSTERSWMQSLSSSGRTGWSLRQRLRERKTLSI